MIQLLLRRANHDLAPIMGSIAEWLTVDIPVRIKGKAVEFKMDRTAMPGTTSIAIGIYETVLKQGADVKTIKIAMVSIMITNAVTMIVSITFPVMMIRLGGLCD